MNDPLVQHAEHEPIFFGALNVRKISQMFLGALRPNKAPNPTYGP